MKRDLVRQILVVVSVLAMIVVNVLANALPINGLNTGEISDRFNILFVPAGYVFSIWGLIYIGLIAFVVYQVLPSQAENPRLRKIGYLVVLSSLANIAWIFLWHYLVFPPTLIAMGVLLLSLIAIYLLLDIRYFRSASGRAPVLALERWLVDVPFSLYLGWITVATVANVSQVLNYAGWGAWGISVQVWAIVMLVVATIIAGAVSLTRSDVAYVLVLIWAFIGIALKHAGVAAVSITAWILVGVNAALLLAGVLMKPSK
ncbi:MAG: tryptophan-rich sensory protein [Anaerolineales bacterium]|nr:tryptophan-rich sensory protein [Anaerolineales bacterium]